MPLSKVANAWDVTNQQLSERSSAPLAQLSLFPEKRVIQSHWVLRSMSEMEIAASVVEQL